MALYFLIAENVVGSWPAPSLGLDGMTGTSEHSAFLFSLFLFIQDIDSGKSGPLSLWCWWFLQKCWWNHQLDRRKRSWNQCWWSWTRSSFERQRLHLLTACPQQKRRRSWASAKHISNYFKNLLFIIIEHIWFVLLMLMFFYVCCCFCFCCQAQPQLNSTLTQIKAEDSFILKQIQPPDQTSKERRLICQFQFQLKQRLMLGLFSNNFFYPLTHRHRQSPSHLSRPGVKGDLKGPCHQNIFFNISKISHL